MNEKSTTVQSAVTHFFGVDAVAADSDKNITVDNSLISAGSNIKGGDETEVSYLKIPPSDANNTKSSASNNDDANGGLTVHIPNNIEDEDTESLFDKARSISPSFSIFSASTSGGCGVGGRLYNHLQCDVMSSATSSESMDKNAAHLSDSHDDGIIAQQQQQQQQQPLIDFTPQTWLTALQETSPTIRYCAAAAALTAVIVIHPLALIGAVATASAAAGATAISMWAVGFFHELDKYQIWSEEFGLLFWEDNDTSGVGRGMKMISDTALVSDATIESTTTDATAAVSDSSLLLEQERQKLGEKVKVVKIDGESGKVSVPTDEKGEKTIVKKGDESGSTSSGLVGIEKREDDVLSSFGKTKVVSKKIPYGLRRIKSAPVTVKLPSSSKKRDKEQNQQTTGGKPPSLSIKPRIKKKQQETTSSPSSSAISKQPTVQRTESPKNKIINDHFPPLEICVIQSVELPGLNTTSQIFDVFFADDAVSRRLSLLFLVHLYVQKLTPLQPYSFRDFQKRLGDVDIVYERWEDCHLSGDSVDGKDLYSFKKGKEEELKSSPLPIDSSRQRRMTFLTLTKSYFGPAYAKATKIQRATQLSNGSILVIENVTQLADIPFSDRFRVIERWILEVTGEQSTGGEAMLSATAVTTCKLTVHAEVQMLKPCSWEAQIRKRAAETFSEVVTEWYKSARVALIATEEQKRKRLRLSKLDEGEKGRGKDTIDMIGSTEPRRSLPPLQPPATSYTPPRAATPLSTKQSELFAKHKRNFDELDKLVAKGDLEWCSVEVMHSSHINNPSPNKESFTNTFSTVLEYPSLNEYEVTSSNAGSTEDENGRSSRRKGIMRRRSSRLLKKLSSRMTNKSSPK